MKPIIKYPGGKRSELCHILPYVPEFSDRYIEPFLGGGALYFHLEPQGAIINDINTGLIRFYSGIRDNYAKVKAELDELSKVYQANRDEYNRVKTEHPNEYVTDSNAELYYKMRDMLNGVQQLEYDYASVYYFINRTAYGGLIRYNKQGQFNVPYGRYKTFNPGVLTEGHSRLLSTAEIHNTGYTNIFNRAEGSDFIFLDPPYDCAFSSYGNATDFGEYEHRKLAEDFTNLHCKALMVISATELTTELYSRYTVGKYSKVYATNIKNRFTSQAEHIVITNYKGK